MKCFYCVLFFLVFPSEITHVIIMSAITLKMNKMFSSHISVIKLICCHHDMAGYDPS